LHVWTYVRRIKIPGLNYFYYVLCLENTIVLSGVQLIIKMATNNSDFLKKLKQKEIELATQRYKELKLECK
jgi:hypothetical protein